MFWKISLIKIFLHNILNMTSVWGGRDRLVEALHSFCQECYFFEPYNTSFSRLINKKCLILTKLKVHFHLMVKDKQSHLAGLVSQNWRIHGGFMQWPLLHLFLFIFCLFWCSDRNVMTLLLLLHAHAQRCLAVWVH